MNQLQIFNNSNFGQVRAIELDGKPYVVGVDVARALEYANPSKAVIDHCKGISKIGIPSDGGIQETNVIPEGDIFRLIVKAADQSRNSEIKVRAEAYERWIFDEVLPSIRKHGMYAANELLDNPDLLIQVATKLKEERALRLAAEGTVVKQKQIIGELKPKADYTDLILRNKGLVTITQIAKDYGMSGQEMNELLHTYGVQYKQSGQWLLYEKHQDKGYTHSETINITRTDGRPDIKMNTKWTQKGRLFIYNLLKDNNVLPVIERAA